jgi:hypothetical protein
MVDLKTALADARERLNEAQQESHALETKITKLHEEVRGLELALAYHGGVDIEILIPTKNGWTKMSRTGAVEAMLREMGPLGPSEIARLLRERGRTKDKPRYVSAAIAYLKKQGVVHSTGYGQWTLSERTDEAPLDGQASMPSG